MSAPSFVLSLALVAASGGYACLVTGQEPPGFFAVQQLRSGERIWIGPNPFEGSRRPGAARSQPRTLRDDWLATLVDSSKWPVVLKNAAVFKTYLMILQSESGPAPGLSDGELRQLVQFMRSHGLKIAFEVGGLRTSAAVCGDSAGELRAKRELALLKRWLSAGGSIDYLTTDHAVMKNLRGVSYRGPGQDPNRACKMSVQELTEELGDYFQMIHKELPNARLGVIESLGFFQVQAHGKLYRQTDRRLPVWKFEEYFDDLLAAMKRRALELDHFHIDFGFEGAAYDGKSDGTLDVGRIVAVEAYVKSRGVRSGVIFNATYDRRNTNPQPDIVNREVYERTLAFFKRYISAERNADHRVLQTWQPYPDRTGPETEPFTVLNIARDIINLELGSHRSGSVPAIGPFRRCPVSSPFVLLGCFQTAYVPETFPTDRQDDVHQLSVAWVE